MSEFTLRLLGLGALALILSGCSSLNKYLDNRAVCAVGDSTAYTLSLYGPIGLSSKLNSADSSKICPKVEVAK